MEEDKKVNQLINNLNQVEIIDAKFQDVVKLSKEEKEEGLVLLGAGGDLHEWIDGISNELLKEGIATGNKHTMWNNKFYKLESTGGRTDFVMLFKNKTTINVGKMAIWRLKFGDNSWLSDFIVNYKSHY